jgi:SDR family mycofactocin-dependent oxidoreductase
VGKLTGKVALVTGAARGQGRSHAVRLAQEGADIIAVDICRQIASVPYDLATESDLEQTAKLVEAEDRRIVTAVADVRDATALREAVGAGVAQLGRLDVVVANAGICSFGGVRELTAEAWNDMISVNLTGAFTTAQATVEHLIAAGGGAFIATSSVYGLKGNGSAPHYTAAKHGLTGLIRAMTHELAPFHIRVNSIHPTSVSTDMVHNDAMYRLFRPDLDAPTTEDVEDGFTSINVLPVPWVEAVDVSNAVVFLASDDARYITGVSLPVDAGCMQT